MGNPALLAGWRNQRGSAAGLALLAQLVHCRTVPEVARATTAKDLTRLAQQLRTTRSAAGSQVFWGLTVLVLGAWYRQCPAVAQKCLETILQQPAVAVENRAVAAWGLGFLRVTPATALRQAAAAPEELVAQAAHEALLVLEQPPVAERAEAK